MALRIRFSEEKNQILKATRGIGFEEVVWHLQNGDLLDEKEHHTKKRSNQRLFLVKIKKYVYVVPFVVNAQKNEAFLKTIYPSRRYTRLYLRKGGKNDQ